MENLPLAGNVAERPKPSPFLTYIPTAAVILLVIYAVAYYVWPSDSSVVAMGPYEVHGSSTTLYPPIQLIDFATMTKKFSNNFTFGFYVYISDVTKPLFVGQATPIPLIKIPGAGSITIDAQQNLAIIALEPTNPPGQVNPMSVVKVPQFMPARWNQLLFTVEGRTVDVYLNGILASSTLLDNIPLARPTVVSLNVQPGFDGQLGYAQAWPKRLTMTEILANYKRTCDYKGKPNIPESPFDWAGLLSTFQGGFCSLGVCFGDEANRNPLQFIDYQY
jgi:hypothetical protein